VSDFDRQRLTAKRVDDGQDVKDNAIAKRVPHEVHAPQLIHIDRLRHDQAEMRNALLSPFGTHNQPFFFVQAVDSLDINLPPFTTQKHVKAPVTVPWTSGS
jgi:hypothetical protein